MISTIALILVLLAAVAGIIYSVHREAHHDCSNGCADCAIAKSCKRAVMVLTALLVMLTSSGINIEHHCHHCRQAEAAACCHDHGNCEHCDHCANCFFLHLDLDQYNLTQHIDLPTPEMICLPMLSPLAETTQLLCEAEASLHVQPHAPPLPGRDILHTISKLSL